METHNILNGCGCHQQSPQTPFNYALPRNTARPFTHAFKKQTSHEGDSRLALIHTLEPLFTQVGTCRKIAHVFCSVDLFVELKLLFRVFSNQDSSRVSSSVIKLNAGLIVCVRATPSVAVFFEGTCEKLQQVPNGNDSAPTRGPLNGGLPNGASIEIVMPHVTW